MSGYTKEQFRSITLGTEKKYGLPADTLFKIAGIESGYKPGQVSPKGAKGWFQFIDSTAKQYGLDDPHDLGKAADAAGRYMRDLLKQYGGSMDSALAHYNGGGRAVRALNKGQPWPETADYLAKFNGKDTTGKAVKLPELSTQFTGMQTAPSIDGPTQSSIANTERARANQFDGVINTVGNLGGAVAAGFENENTAWNYYKTKGIQDSGKDVDWDSPEAKAALSRYSKDHWDYLAEAGTEGALQGRMARLDEALKNQEKLSQYGVGLALTGSMIGSLPDLPTLIGAVPGLGGGALLSKTSRIANAVRMAAGGAAGNVAWEAASAPYRPTATDDDLYMAGLFGLGLGGAVGAAVNPRKLALAAENSWLKNVGWRRAREGQEREISDTLHPPRTDAGAPLTPPKGAPEAPTPVPPKDAPEGPILGPDGKPLVLAPEPPPTSPKGSGEPTLPPKAPDAPAAPEAPVAKEPPVKRKWDEEWDTPRYTGKDQILELPPVKKFADMVAYIKQFSKNKDMVLLLEKSLKTINQRNLRFEIVDPKVMKNIAPGKGKLSPRMYAEMNKPGVAGLAATIPTDIGATLQIALKGRGGKAHGMTEEVFVHEVLHAATVHKWERVSGGFVKKGLKQFGPETVGLRTKQAYNELARLYAQVRKEFNTRKDLIHGEHFLADAKEFISYGLTNRQFQAWLRNIDVGGTTSVWRRFTNAIRDFLGLDPKDTSALTKLIALSDDLLAPAGMERNRPSRRTVLEPANEFIDAATVQAADDVGMPPVFGWGLGLEHRLGSQKIPPKVRDLAAKLFGTTVGYKGHAVVKRNAYDDTIGRHLGWSTRMKKVGYAEFETWRKAEGKPWWKKGEQFEQFSEQVDNYVRGIQGNYPPQVRKAGDAIADLLEEVVDEINNPALRRGGVKKGLTESEALDETTGETVLIGKLDKNRNYLPRKHDVVKAMEFVRRFGKEGMEAWWAGAYRNKHPNATAEEAKKWAGWYVRTVEDARMNRGAADHLEEMMSGYDEKSLLESLVRNGGFTEQEAHKIIGGMFRDPAKDTGRTASSLRHRNLVDETYSQRMIDRNGVEVDVTINDFINTNVFDTVDSYLRRVSSSISLADHLDVYKQSDIGRLIDNATDRTFATDVSDSVMVKAKEDLKFTFDRLQGIPQEETTGFNKAMDMWGKFNVIRLMGGAVWNQAQELSQVVGTMGWRATLGAVAELRSIRRDLRTGKAPHDFLDHLENTIGGVGAELVERINFAPRHDWIRMGGDTAWNRKLDKLDTGLGKMAQGVLDYTGMTGMMIQQKRVHAIALANHFINSATGRIKSGFLNKDRLAWMGMSEADFARLQDGIRRYTRGSRQGEYAKTDKFDFKAFARDEPELNSMLMTAIQRESRRAIQENDLASMVPLMGTTLGKAVFQFMNFVIHAWNKSMLFAMNHRDFSTFSTMMHGAFFSSLTYMGRTNLQALGMSDEERQRFMAQRMGTKQLVANSFGRMAQASLLPQLYDSTIGNFTGAMFSGMRTTSDVSSIASNPTLQAVEGVLSLGKIGRNAFSDELQTTSKDVRAWGRLVPLNNVAPLSTFINAIAADYPYNEKQSGD